MLLHCGTDIFAGSSFPARLIMSSVLGQVSPTDYKAVLFLTLLNGMYGGISTMTDKNGADFMKCYSHFPQFFYI
jgi:hypothetical protein